MSNSHTVLQQESLACIVPDRIVLATDLLDVDYLLPHAIAQCKACAAALFIVHVIASVKSASLEDAVNPVTDITRGHVDQRHQHARCVLNAAWEKAQTAGIACEAIIRDGNTCEEIAKLVSEVQAERLILGTHVRNNLQKFLLGSTALEILKNTEVPVWAVGPIARPFPHGQPSRILHPVSLSCGYQKTAELAFKLSQVYEAEITLLHVLPSTSLVEQTVTNLIDSTTRVLGQLIPGEASLWTTARVMVQAGDISEQITAVASELKVDLIVLGAKPSNGRWPIHGDDTVYNVIARANCPVLTMRHGHWSTEVCR
jgi:nucleotide-binding universal stress UspA family protein